MDPDKQLKTRVQNYKQIRESLITESASLERQHQSPLAVIMPQKINAVATVLNKRPS